MYAKRNISNPSAISIIQNAITTKLPFSFVRIGDGEIFILKELINKPAFKRYCRNYGYPDTTEGRKQLVKDFKPVIIEAIQNADMIGVLPTLQPNIHYGIEDWGLPAEYLRENQPVCDMMIVRGNELGNINNFAKLIKNSSLRVISCNYPTNDLKMSLPSGTAFQVDSFNNLKHTQRMLEITTAKEDVVIFGASFAGKNIAKFHPEKTVIDFGATLDAWNGIISRNSFKNIYKHCLIK